MDVQDVSSEHAYINMLRQARNVADQAKSRKGQTVSVHPPPALLIAKFMMNLNILNLRNGFTANMIQTSQIPAPYDPCSRPMDELRPIKISNMRLETHHRGRKVTVRVLTPPQRMTAIMAIVEDEDGTAILLQLYHQPDELQVPANELIRPDMVLILKEPYFKCCTDGSYSLRVDHVSDVIWTEGTEAHVPAQWRKLMTVSTNSANIRQRGNLAVKHQNWAQAQRFYTHAIKTAASPEEEQLAYLNRSLTNLKLGRSENALLDAAHTSGAASASEKCLFREARAFYELGRFKHSLKSFHDLIQLHPENKDAMLEIQRVRKRLREQQNGEYDFRQLQKQAKLTPPLIDCATYSVPVEIRDSPGRGQGLFTTMPVSSGQLLMCEKAFAYSYAGSDVGSFHVLMNLSTGRVTVGGQARLLTQIVQKTHHNPDAGRLFEDLHRGDNGRAGAAPEVDGGPVVDSFLVEKIISLNAFGAPRTSLDSLSTLVERTASEAGPPNAGHTTCGIWLLASRINHSCLGNCRRSFIGDAMVIRATRDLEAGTELVFPYQHLEPLASYAQVQKNLKNWGFSCSCERCQALRKTTAAVLARRGKIHKELATVLSRRVVNVDRTLPLLDKLEKTYAKTDGILARPELWDPYFVLGTNLLDCGKPVDAAKMMVKGLEALGFSITAEPSVGSKKPPLLEITQWGYPNELVPWAFLNLFKAYRQIAPTLCNTVKEYGKIAYAMVVGESETFLDVYPEFA